MGRPKTFLDHIKKVFIDVSGRKCYEFPGMPGYHYVNKSPAISPCSFSHYEIYEKFWGISKKMGVVKLQKRILKFKEYEAAEAKHKELSQKSSAYQQNRLKILTVAGIGAWLDQLCISEGLKKQVFPKYDFSLMRGASKLLCNLYGERTLISDLSVNLPTGLCSLLRDQDPQNIVIHVPEFTFLTQVPGSSTISNTNNEKIVRIVNYLLRQARKRMDQEIHAVYFTSETSVQKTQHAAATNSLTVEEKETFFRLLILINEEMKKRSIDDVDHKLWSLVLSGLTKAANPQRNPLFECATLSHFIYNIELVLSRHIMDSAAEAVRNTISILMVPKALKHTNKHYKSIIVPSTISDAHHMNCAPRRAYKEANPNSPDPFVYSRTALGIPIHGRPVNVTASMIENFYRSLQDLLGFKGRLSPHSSKDNFFISTLVDKVLTDGMELTGNSELAEIKQFYLPVTIGGETVQANDLVIGLVAAKQFDVKYIKLRDMGLDGIGKRATAILNGIIEKSRNYKDIVA